MSYAYEEPAAISGIAAHMEKKYREKTEMTDAFFAIQTSYLYMPACSYQNTKVLLVQNGFHNRISNQ